MIEAHAPDADDVREDGLGAVPLLAVGERRVLALGELLVNLPNDARRVRDVGAEEVEPSRRALQGLSLPRVPLGGAQPQNGLDGLEADRVRHARVVERAPRLLRAQDFPRQRVLTQGEHEALDFRLGLEHG